MERQLHEYLQDVPSCSHRTYTLTQDYAVFDYTRAAFYVKERNTFQNRVILFVCGASAGATALTVTAPL